MSDHEQDDGNDPLVQLAAMGYSGGEAVDALMQCQGNVMKAAEYLSTGNDEDPGKKKKSKKVKKSKKQEASNKKKLEKELSFQERRKLEIEQRKAKRDSKKVCRVCGGPHPRRECPGIVDGGRGQSRWHDPAARLKDRHQRREHKQQLQESDFSGTWTEAVPFLDGFANLQAVFLEANPSEEDLGQEENDDSLSPLAQWIQQWAILEAELGKSASLVPDKVQKQQLKTLRVRVLRDKALEVLLRDDEEEETAQAAVDAAMDSGNPQSELIKIILAANEEPPQKRTVRNEWPGYRGCLAPFAVMDLEAMDALQHLKGLDNNIGVRALLAIPPAEVAKCMVVESTPAPGGATGDTIPIDMSAVIRMTDEVDRIKSELISAQKVLLASRSKKAKAKAEQKVARLSKLLASQRDRNAKAGSEEMLAALSTARLSQTVGEQLEKAIANYTLESTATNKAMSGNDKLVVGVSCGLDYRTPEAVHAQTGAAVRQAQREACECAVKAAVKANLPIVLECHNVPPPEKNSSNQDLEEQQVEENATVEIQIEYASSDLVRILASAVRPDATLLLRSGSLTVAPQPGLQKLLDAFPNFFVGFSSSLTYAKCPKELLDVAYDVPLERLVLTSEAPYALPAALGGAKQGQQCVPSHAACAAEAIAKIKSGAVGADRETVLRASTLNLCRGFGLSELSASLNETVDGASENVS